MIKGEVRGDQLQEYNTNAFKDFNEKALCECPNCHRTFLPRPLEIHLRSCKPKSPAAAAAVAESPDPEKRPNPRKYKPPRLKKRVVAGGGGGGGMSGKQIQISPLTVTLVTVTPRLQ